jgi:uncharacterized protein (TIGR03086 family)
MSTQPLQQAIAATRSVMTNVTADQLGDATPCASWDVAALINHVIGGQNFFAAGLAGEKPSAEEVDYAAGDYVAAFDQAATATVAAFGADGAMTKLVKMPFGEMPGSALMGLATTDTFQHGWDLAKATGQSTDLEPELASEILAQCRQSISDAFRGPEGAPFGPAQDSPEGAAPADQLAAFLGRSV